MLRIILFGIFLCLPFQSKAYTCDDVDPERVIKEAYYLGEVSVDDVIDPFGGDEVTGLGNAPPSEGRYDVIISPIKSYKGGIEDSMKISVFPMECSIFKHLKKGETRKVILLKGLGNIRFAPTTYKLPNKIWEDLRNTTEKKAD